MSFNLCKKITLDEKTKKIKCCVASNNVTPKKYQFCEICNDNYKDYSNYSFDDKLITLFYSMQNGEIQISTINENTENYVYALIKVKEYLNAKKMDNYNDLYKKICDNFSLKALWNIYGDIFKIWKQALTEKIDGDYIVLFNNYYNVTKLGRYNRGYNKFEYCHVNGGKFKKLSYKHAYIFKSQMGEKMNLKIAKI